MISILAGLISSRCQGITNQIELRMRNFLWANKKLHFINQARICVPQKYEGLVLARLDRKMWHYWENGGGNGTQTEANSGER